MKKYFIYVGGLLAVIIGALTFQQVNKLSQPEYALYYQEPREIKPFKLTDHNGQLFSKKQLNGKWSLVFFGYTSCPDVCPTTLQNLGFIYDELKAISANSQVLLVSVDPKRDTQEKLSQYIAYFNAEFIALRGGHEVLFPFARNMGLMYAISGEGEDYLVDHSASIVLVNPDGNIAAIFKPEQAVGKVPSIDSDKLLSDYQKIVALY
ncbi:SCO family protein [Colwellia sp. MSW7]|jgi:protein SCO1/2|uniref:SCO family protein n=1 Tax=Colwellia maritima TaxID=2912588 RepID=A0ABS9WXG1_9GAMM|nr:SCO family protein [Colwellia maritima]MCI2282680.1 SCO family protein [Colwellia maritima]